MRSPRASHIRIGFTLLHEVKEGLTGKLLLGGFCLTGLIGGRRSADDYAAKYQGKSETFHGSLSSQEGRLILTLAGADFPPSTGFSGLRENGVGFDRRAAFYAINPNSRVRFAT